MKLERDLGSILKKGSRTGYLGQGQLVASKSSSTDILLTPAERGVLKYVGNTCVVWGVSLEANGENIVLVVSGNVQIFRSSLLMLEFEGRKLQFRYVLLALEPERMLTFSELWRLVETGQ